MAGWVYKFLFWENEEWVPLPKILECSGKVLGIGQEIYKSSFNELCKSSLCVAFTNGDLLQVYGEIPISLATACTTGGFSWGFFSQKLN